MAWRRPGDKPLSEPMMVSLLTHICITRPPWVKCIQPWCCRCLTLWVAYRVDVSEHDVHEHVQTLSLLVWHRPLITVWVDTALGRPLRQLHVHLVLKQTWSYSYIDTKDICMSNKISCNILRSLKSWDLCLAVWLLENLTGNILQISKQ